MKRSFTHILNGLLFASVIHMSAFAELSFADSVIRIIGDRAAKSQDNSSGQPQAESAAPPTSGNTAIKIISGKPNASRLPSREQAIGADPPINESHIAKDKAEAVQETSPGKPVSIKVTETTEGVKKATEKESLSQKSPEQEIAERLEVLRVEKERRDAEKLEMERLARLKAEQERAAAETARIESLKREQELLAARKAEEERKIEQENATAEAARIAALKREQEQLAVRNVEEVRKALEKIELERVEALKAEEERLAGARRALPVEPPAEPNTSDQQAVDISSSEDIHAATALGIEASQNLVTGNDKISGQALETIWDLYLSAKANDPALGRSKARVTGSRADSDQLFSTFMPHLDSSAGVQQISQTLTHYNTSNDVKYDYTSFNYSLIARMTLLNVPAIYSLSAADAGLRIEQAGVVTARQNLIMKFTDAYFALLKAQADTRIALGEIKRLKQVLDQSRAFFKEGTGDLISVYEAQSRLDGAGADLTRSDSTLRLAEQKLSSVVGKPVKSIVNYLPQQPAKAEPDDLDWWVATMEKEQPVLRQAREGLVQSSEQRKSVKAEYLPILQTSGGYTVSRGTPDLPSAEVQQWFVGASISLPWYSGGETAAKVRRAVASEEERQHSFDETIEQLRENVKQAFYNLRYNVSLIRALEQKMTSAEIQLDAVKKGRNMGIRNAIDLLNAEQSYSLALRDYKYALYDNFMRLFQLKSAAGILADDDVAEVAKKASPTLSSQLRFFPEINPN